MKERKSLFFQRFVKKNPPENEAFSGGMVEISGNAEN